ncbi:hypothetical protein, partial [Enterococcus faecium]|uniref:hypothetical protein n=1 Tax=Enterococcus faecium TaxID=1352 RepID=UPI003CE4E375
VIKIIQIFLNKLSISSNINGTSAIIRSLFVPNNSIDEASKKETIFSKLLNVVSSYLPQH